MRCGLRLLHVAATSNALRRNHRRQSEAAEALVTLVQSSYPSAAITFTRPTSLDSPPRNVLGDLDVLHAGLHSRLATQAAGASAESLSGDGILARRTWRPSPPSDASSFSPALTRWWEVVAALSPPSRTLASVFDGPASVPHFCPDAVVFIDGVEAADVAQVVAPQLLRGIPNLVTPESVGGSGSTHAGQRREPIYCRRKLDWDAVWREKKCAMRGVDLLELSLPLATAVRERRKDEEDAPRASMVVAVANPTVTVAALHRQTNTSRRGPLRSSFGYALPCLESALPTAVVTSVRMLRAWQQQQQQLRLKERSKPCTSAFWVSAVAHLVDSDVSAAAEPASLHTSVVELLSSAAAIGLSEMEVQLLRALSQPSMFPSSITQCTTSVGSDVMALLLFFAVAQRACSLPALRWNAVNYFLPIESFEGTSDWASAATLLESGLTVTPEMLCDLRRTFLTKKPC